VVDGHAGLRVAVTGCASGIGERVAVRLRERGAVVVGLDVREPVVDVDAFVPIDLGDSASVARAAEAVGAVDALVNVAGVSGTLDPATVVGINFVGTRELTEALVPRMAPGSAVVMTASLAASRHAERADLVAGLLATGSRAQAEAWCRAHRREVGTGYAISKDALVRYTLDRAVDLAGRGIRLNAVAPGMTETPILAATRASRGDAFLEAIPMPLGRVATADEQAAVLVFLAGRDASYVAGQVIWVDGGYSAGVAAGRLPHVTGSVGEPPADA
jgi:Dehydrogenases with different specificities (related to short-chain alcohol dehydrogenases)